MQVVDTQVKVCAAKSQERNSRDLQSLRRGGEVTGHQCTPARHEPQGVRPGFYIPQRGDIPNSNPRFVRRNHRSYWKPAHDEKRTAAWTSRTRQEETEGEGHETNTSSRAPVSSVTCHLTVMETRTWTQDTEAQRNHVLVTVSQGQRRGEASDLFSYTGKAVLNDYTVTQTPVSPLRPNTQKQAFPARWAELRRLPFCEVPPALGHLSGHYQAQHSQPTLSTAVSWVTSWFVPPGPLGCTELRSRERPAD